MKVKVSGEISEKFLVDSSYYSTQDSCLVFESLGEHSLTHNLFVFSEARSERLRSVTTATAANRPTQAQTPQAKNHLRMTRTVMMASTVVTRNQRRTRCVKQSETKKSTLFTDFIVLNFLIFINFFRCFIQKKIA